MTVIPFIIIAVIAIVAIKILTSKGIDPIEEYKKNKKKPSKPLRYRVQPKPSPAKAFSFYAGILEEKFPYYQKLSESKKQIFLQYLDIFIRTHKFKPVEMPEVTLEMKTMISATAVQLSFGLKNFLSSGIRGFIVYPSVYYLKQARSMAKGHYSQNGVVHLAYDYFEKGHEIVDDGINLGLHEMAHALHHLYQRKMGYWFFFNDVVRHWFEEAKDGHHIQRPGEVEGFLRKYAATNVQEFFAVCVENYFERPKELNERLPDVYKHLCFILNQNILGIPLLPEVEMKHTEGQKPIFQEDVNVVGSIVMLVIGALFFGIVSFQLGEFPPPFIFFAIVLAVISFLNLSSTRRIEFYNDYILVRSIFNKNNIKLVPVQTLLYIGHYRKMTRSGTVSEHKNVLSFVHYNRGVRELADVIAPSKKFLSNVQMYCKKKGLNYVHKI